MQWILAAYLLLVLNTNSLPINSPLLSSYDYIIVGGGPAGLTVAMRLSEDPSINVLLLEAGPEDSGEPEVEVPGLVGEDIGGIYDWNLTTVPQIYLDGQVRSLPQGRVLGGGTIINGMLWSRGGQGDYADWEALGNPGWGWADLLPYFIKSEAYTPVANEALAALYSIEEDPAAHGVDGPVSVSFPDYFWNSSSVLFDALNELGVPTAYDPNAGLVAGASFLPLDIDPITQTRADARRAYYDPYAWRPNLWVSTGQMVTQILFEDRPTNGNASTAASINSSSIGTGRSPGMPFGIFGGTTTANLSHALDQDAASSRRSTATRFLDLAKGFLCRRQAPLPPFLTDAGAANATSDPSSAADVVAIGVEFAADASSPRQTIHATREVIVAAGAIHSPQLLMLSGVGPATALQALDIAVNVDLPGVGQNLQDHGQVWAWYPYHNPSYSNPTELSNNETFLEEAWIDYWTNRTGPLTATAIDGVAFPALAYIVNGSDAIADEAMAQLPDQYLVAGVDSTVLAGYTAQKTLMTDALQDITRAAYELINANDGVLTVATMRPFSRGTITLSANDPFTPPLIDPRYASNPLDTAVLRAALAFNTRLLRTPSLAALEPVQALPPPDATPAELAAYIAAKWQTEYHPAGSCAMMPRGLGGVVDPALRVYGTRNLRVVDSSILPLLPAAHLQAVVYGVAEKAADLIKAAQNEASSVDSASVSASSAVNATTERTRNATTIGTMSGTEAMSFLSSAAIFANNDSTTYASSASAALTTGSEMSASMRIPVYGWPGWTNATSIALATAAPSMTTAPPVVLETFTTLVTVIVTDTVFRS